METKKVVLADSSYTIRRITELSFSEEEGIELITLENGFNIKEKLIELKPAVALVDIKLSGLNGYDVCKFINETESLKDVQVFLMKGGFEPINEGLLKDLKYVDIITKPFDSNELVSSIKDMLDKGSVKAPPIAPEDLPEIDSIEENEEEISFSDIEEELKSNKIISEDMDQEDEEVYMEEVLPSEEITQGPQIERESPLDANTYDTDEIENPFKEETAVVKEKSSVKEEIKVEKELIGTEEAEKKPVDEKEEQVTASEIEEEPVEEKVEDFFTISETEEPSEPVETEEAEKKPVDEKEEQSVEEKVKDFFAASETKEPSESAELEEAEEQPKEEKVEEKIEIEEELEKEEIKIEEKAEEKIEIEEKLEKEEIKIEEIAEEKIEIEEELEKEEIKIEEKVEEKIEIEEEFEKEEIKIEEKVEKPEPAVEKKELEDVKEISQEQKEEIFEKVEDKLTLAIKEILWEIVPPLADKIIKEEINQIKSDINS